MNPSSQAVTNALTTRLLAWVLSRRTPEAERNQGDRFFLTYGKVYRRIAVGPAVLFTAILGGSIAGTWDNPKALAICAGIFGLLELVSLWAVYDAFFVEVSVDSDGISRKGVFGEPVVISWPSISRIRFSQAMNSFRIRGPNRTLSVSVYRNGLATLTEVARSKLDEDSFAAGLDELSEWARNPGRAA